jgi:hypothetical protein
MTGKQCGDRGGSTQLDGYSDLTSQPLGRFTHLRVLD